MGLTTSRWGPSCIHDRPTRLFSRWAPTGALDHTSCASCLKKSLSSCIQRKRGKSSEFMHSPAEITERSSLCVRECPFSLNLYVVATTLLAKITPKRCPPRLIELLLFTYHVLLASSRSHPQSSSWRKVKRHAALVLGNICQTDAHREIAGKEGAVEGLFALCDANDGVVQANALWALGNLAWDHCNQVITNYYSTWDHRQTNINLI